MSTVFTHAVPGFLDDRACLSSFMISTEIILRKLRTYVTIKLSYI